MQKSNRSQFLYLCAAAALTDPNSAPLVYSFTQGSLRKKYDFIGDEAPSRCAEMLEAGECEIVFESGDPVSAHPRFRGLYPKSPAALKNCVPQRLRQPRAARSRRFRRPNARPRVTHFTDALVRYLFLRRYGSLPECAERALGALRQESGNPSDDAERGAGHRRSGDEAGGFERVLSTRRLLTG